MDWLWLLETNKICEQQEKAGEASKKILRSLWKEIQEEAVEPHLEKQNDSK